MLGEFKTDENEDVSYNGKHLSKHFQWVFVYRKCFEKNISSAEQSECG